MTASVSYACLSMRKLLDSAGGSIYVKLLRLMPSLDSRGRILGSILTDSTLRQPALSP